MKYPLDKELHSLCWHKIPRKLKLFPILNMILGLFPCMSDAKVEVSVRKISGYENATLKMLIIEPKKNSADMPCLVYFHGGGFLLKASGSHYKIAKEYAQKLLCKVVIVDYRLAPKHSFPVPVEDCFATYRWVLDNAEMFGIDTNKIMLGGDSAGGNLATAVTLMARDRQLPLPTALFLIYPVTDRRMLTKSMKEYIDTPVWNAELTKMMWEAYLGKKTPEHMEYASPMEAASFKQFPPTYVEVAEYDALRDEGILLYERLKKENIDAELYEIKNACHGFEVVVNSTIIRKCMSRRIKWLQRFI